MNLYPYRGGIFDQMAEHELVAALRRRLGLGDAGGKEVLLVGSAWVEPVDDTGRKQLGLLVEGALWTVPEAEGGVAIGRLIGYAFGGSDPRRGFFTSSGRVELFNAQFAEKNDLNGRPVDSGPVFTPRDWLPDEDLPLYLINGKEASHTHTRSQNDPLLVQLEPEDPLRIHPDTATRFGVRDGQEVVVESPYGSARGIAQVTTAIHRLVVGAQHGFGHTALGMVAKGRGSAFGDLNTLRYDPVSGQASHKEIRVPVRPV